MDLRTFDKDFGTNAHESQYLKLDSQKLHHCLGKSSLERLLLSHHGAIATNICYFIMVFLLAPLSWKPRLN
ncbi:hypothetical protein [Nostoc sp.]|uniref:hypothetical protein n=1 Tax=Nostoc sp. TaxID=1180 RepID=UPI002FF460FF